MSKPNLKISAIAELSPKEIETLKKNIKTLQEQGIFNLSPAEIKMLAVAQDIAGDYYDVDYDKKNQNLILTAKDLSLNKYFPEKDYYPYDMSALKRGFALQVGVLLKHNPELNALYNSLIKNEHKTFVPINKAIDNNDQFYCQYFDIDTAILLPNQSMIIPLNKIGQKPRECYQSERDFDIFREVVEQNKVK